MLWIVIALFLFTAVLLVGLPFYKNHSRQTQQQMLSFKQNLASIDLDEKSGELSPAEAEKQRKDTARRIIALEDEAQSASSLNKVDRTIFISLAALIIIGAFGLYSLLGSPQLASPAPIISQGATSNDFEEAIVRLMAHLEEKPDDGQAWRLLAWSLSQSNQFEQAKIAYEKALALTPNNSEALSGYGELLTLRANGQVTEQALKAFNSALIIDPLDPRAGYYSSIAKQQSGDDKSGLDIWVKMLQNAPDDAKWKADLLQETRALADKLGLLLPADLQAPKRPSPDQIAAGKNMSPKQQQALIKTMIKQLEQRLEKNPNDLAGWLQLIRSYQVQGDNTKAQAAYAQARQTFANNPKSLASLETAISAELMAKTQ